MYILLVIEDRCLYTRTRLLGGLSCGRDNERGERDGEKKYHGAGDRGRYL